ncbi:MAG: tRNA preQ1(34) S-adenosylmethionine ribosyltransferase-isomerase QueA [Gemmatimonadales bacterium]
MSGPEGVGSRLSDYDYELPRGRIARYPTERRDESRLLAVVGDDLRDLRFRDIVELFEPNDVLVVNETKVFPARLLGRKPSGAPAEIFLLRPAPGAQDPRVWEALVRPGAKLKPGRMVVVADDLQVEILDSAPGSGRRVRLVTDLPVEAALERHGRVPLPPYLERDDEPLDRERYQTVYARERGSVAAPTAGLHFTPEILAALEARGVHRAALTLHVGIGTFRPVESETLDAHEMHSEWYSLPEPTAEAVNAARARGGRVWAVGTTSVRTLEAVADEGGRVRPATGTTDLFIRPGYRFRVVDCLITNFHLPRSTLLMLVAAFAGYDRTMAAYAHAIAGDYRFYSYGDAMAVVGSSTGRRPGPAVR